MSLERESFYQSILNQVLENPLRLGELQASIADSNLSEEQLKTIYLAAIKLDEKALAFVPEKFCSDDFYISAITSNVRAILEIPEPKRNYAMYLAAVKKAYDALEIVPKEMLTDEMILEGVKNNVKSLDILFNEDPVDINVFNDDINYEILKQSGLALGGLKPERRSEKFCLVALEQDPLAIQYFPEALLTLERYKEAFQKDWRVIKLIPEDVLAKLDKDKILQTCEDKIKNDWQDAKYLPDYLLKGSIAQLVAEKCYKAMEDNWYNFQYLPDALKDEKFCLYAIKKSVNLFENIPPKFRNFTICRIAVMQDETILRRIREPEMRPALSAEEYENLCKLAVEKNPLVLGYVHEDFKEKFYVFIQALQEENTYFSDVKKDWRRLEKVPPVKRSRRVCMTAVKQDPSAIAILKNEQDRLALTPQDYFDLCQRAVDEKPNSINLITDQTVIYKLIDEYPLTVEYLPPIKENMNFYLHALKQDWRVLKVFPKDFVAADNPVLVDAIEQFKINLKKDWDSIKYISDEFLQGDLYQLAKEACCEALLKRECELSDLPRQFKTSEIYLFAVTHVNNSLRDIPPQERTSEIIEKAIQYHPYSLQYIKDPGQRFTITTAQYEKICEQAVTDHKFLLEYVHPDLQDKMKKMLGKQEARQKLLAEIRDDWQKILSVPVSERDYDMYLAAAGNNIEALKLIQAPINRSMLNEAEYKQICLQAIKLGDKALLYVDPKILNYAFLEEGIKYNAKVFRHVNKSLLTKDEYQQLSILAEERNLIEDLKSVLTSFSFVGLLNIVSSKGHERVCTYLKSHPELNLFANAAALANLLKSNTIENLKIYSETFTLLENALVRPENWEDYLINITRLSSADKVTFFDFMMIKYDFPKMMRDFKKYYYEEDTHAEINKIEKMVADKNLEVVLIVEMLHPFTYGFGKIKYMHGLLTCAQTTSRKKEMNSASNYVFEPTIISMFEFDKYMEFLSANTSGLNIRERFCLEGAHWRTGDIQINGGLTDILLMDSIGLPEDDKFRTKRLMAEILLAFPKASLFLDKIKRQQGGRGCSFFSLDDVMHLASIENYLKDKNLFAYFHHQAKKSTISSSSEQAMNANPTKKSEQLNKSETFVYENKTYTYIPVDLPLGLLRNMQYARFKTKIIPARKDEKDLPINKKGQTAFESVKNSYQEEKLINRELNKRLDAKAYKMARYNLFYLMSHSLSEIAQAMQKHTVAGFKQRFAAQHKLKEVKEDKLTKLTPDSISKFRPSNK